MTWWNRKPKEPENIFHGPSVQAESGTGKIIPCDHPKDVILVSKEPEPPPPDLPTKPNDIVGYCFGYVCPKKHVNSTFENITVDGYKERRACQACGAVSKPAVVKRTAEAQWGNKAQPEVYNLNPKPNWGWYNSYTHYFGKTLDWGHPLWTEHEFVHYLDTPKKTKKR